jgi:hypothetical protein
MSYKFIVTFEGESPDNLSGNQMIEKLQQSVNSLPFKLIVKTIDTEGPGLINAPVRPKSSYEDWDNERKAWQ